MNVYIALLRGINVSGQKKIKMADLRALLEEAGLLEVKTYIQSGNIIFKSPQTSREVLANLIHQAIKAHYGFEVPVLVLESIDLESAVAGYPWTDKEDRTPQQTYFTFLESQPEPDLLAALDPNPYPPDEYLIEGRIIYSYYPNGAGRSKMTNNYFERKLKVKATSRNWRTTNKLIEMANG